MIHIHFWLYGHYDNPVHLEAYRIGLYSRLERHCRWCRLTEFADCKTGRLRWTRFRYEPPPGPPDVRSSIEERAQMSRMHG